MPEIKIYIAGPVLRPEPDHDHPRYSFPLDQLYAQIKEQAKYAGVIVQIPYYEEELDQLGARKFAEEITRRILQADAMLVVLFPNRSPSDPANCSIACEAQVGAQKGKPLRILAADARDVPRLLQALAGEHEIYTFENIDFQRVFRDLAEQVKRKD
jgi:nucleoside 2-deoxyribosyltransferase